MSNKEKNTEIFMLKETDTVKITENQAILYSGDCIFKYEKKKVNTKKITSVNYACTTIFKKEKENNCKATLTIKEKRPKSYDMQIEDKYILFGEEPNTESCCYKPLYGEFFLLLNLK